jgi:hypothetical protein
MKWYQRKFFRFLGKAVKTIFWLIVRERVEDKFKEKK